VWQSLVGPDGHHNTSGSFPIPLLSRIDTPSGGPTLKQPYW